jgi:dTDP-4-amino-4,6-dideoxygalactose transaminase
VPVPLVDVGAQFAPVLEELRSRLLGVVDSGKFILGPNVAEFEAEAADYLGVAETVGVANGTDALVLSLEAAGVAPGDEVICPSFTFYATAEAIARVGATPVFCDIEAASLNMDPAHVAELVSERTRAIVAVHLFGRPMDVTRLPAGIPVIEDAAQAFGAGLPGARAGSGGTASTFSFFPTKNLFCLGDGGLVASSDPDLLDGVRLLRFHGSRDKETFELIGYNSRLDEIQAAALRLFLEHIDEWNGARREAAQAYGALGLGEHCALPPDESGHVYHMYVVRSPQRDELARALTESGVAARPYYATPLHLQPVFAALGLGPGSLPETERAASENLALPMWAGISASQQEQVVGAVASATRGASVA